MSDVSHSFSYRFEDPSCAFGAALLQEATHRAESLSFPFILSRGIHPAPLAQSFSKGLLMEQSHSLFLLYRFEESILRLWRTPFSKGLLMERSSLFFFHSVSRIHPAPLAQSFSKGLLMEQSHSLFLLYRLEDPSCAFGAALLQGPTHGADSLSFSFIPLRGIHPTPFGAALLQGPTHGADSLSFPFIPPRGSILRLWRGPSPRAYSWSGFTLFSFHSASRIHPVPLTHPFSQSQPPTPPKGKEPAFADSFPRSCFQP